jgi:hypothetical protein
VQRDGVRNIATFLTAHAAFGVHYPLPVHQVRLTQFGDVHAPVTAGSDLPIAVRLMTVWEGLGLDVVAVQRVRGGRGSQNESETGEHRAGSQAPCEDRHPIPFVKLINASGTVGGYHRTLSVRARLATSAS